MVTSHQGATAPQFTAGTVTKEEDLVHRCSLELRPTPAQQQRERERERERGRRVATVQQKRSPNNNRDDESVVQMHIHTYTHTHTHTHTHTQQWRRPDLGTRDHTTHVVHLDMAHTRHKSVYVCIDSIHRRTALAVTSLSHSLPLHHTVHCALCVCRAPEWLS